MLEQPFERVRVKHDYGAFLAEPEVTAQEMEMRTMSGSSRRLSLTYKTIIQPSISIVFNALVFQMAAKCVCALLMSFLIKLQL